MLADLPILASYFINIIKLLLYVKLQKWKVTVIAIAIVFLVCMGCNRASNFINTILGIESAKDDSALKGANIDQIRDRLS